MEGTEDTVDMASTGMEDTGLVVIEDMVMVNINEQLMIKMESASLVSTSLINMVMDTKASESLQNTFVVDIRPTR